LAIAADFTPYVFADARLLLLLFYAADAVDSCFIAILRVMLLRLRHALILRHTLRHASRYDCLYAAFLPLATLEFSDYQPLLRHFRLLLRCLMMPPLMPLRFRYFADFISYAVMATPHTTYAKIR